MGRAEAYSKVCAHRILVGVYKNGVHIWTKKNANAIEQSEVHRGL